MDMLRLAGVCVSFLGILVLLRKNAPEQALLLTLVLVAGFLVQGMTTLGALLDRMQALLLRTGLRAENLSLLLRAVGIAMVTHISADLCRDSGAQSVATAVEVGGTIATLAIALPLMEEAAGILFGYFT